MTQQTMTATKFSDIESRMDFLHGFSQYLNMAAEKKGEPQLDPAPYERSARKQHAKFYGEDSKYDGKGNVRVQPYSDLPEWKKFKFGQRMSLRQVVYGVSP